jgi:hypothetical protein
VCIIPPRAEFVAPLIGGRPGEHEAYIPSSRMWPVRLLQLLFVACVVPIGGACLLLWPPKPISAPWTYGFASIGVAMLVVAQAVLIKQYLSAYRPWPNPRAVDAVFQKE